MRFLKWVIVLLFLGAGLIGFGYFKLFVNSVYVPNDTTRLYLAEESNLDVVIRQLASQGDLNEEEFRTIAELKQYDSNIKAGFYVIDEAASGNELINILRSRNTPVQVTFSVIRDFNQLAGVVSRQIEPDSSELVSALKDIETASRFGFNQSTFTSMFIPNTYEMYWNSTADDFINRMASEFKAFWNEERIQKLKTSGFTQSQLTTLASIVEAETKHPDEMRTVAGLYINRLDIGMKLQADPTVKFALNEPERKRIYKRDLDIDSPYNTYKYAGLPPGPIALPSIMALNATLDAENHKYLYMCARPDYSGYHNFAKSFSQHNNNRAKYQAFLRKEGIY